MASKEETAAVLAAITVAYPAKFKVEKRRMADTLELWHSMLSDLAEGAALAACSALIASGAWPPTISEIRSEALSVSLGKGRPEAGEAWGEVCRAFGSVGRNKIPQWSSPAITIAVRAVGGWAHLCKGENQAADRARFLENYTGVLERASKEVLTGRAKSVEEALELRLPRAKPALPTPAPRALLSPTGVPQITTEAEAVELYGKGSTTATDMAYELGKKMKR